MFSPKTPLYVVMIGGLFMTLAALLVLRVREEHGDAPGRAVIRGDEESDFTVQQSAQPVPSTGLVDDENLK